MVCTLNNCYQNSLNSETILAYKDLNSGSENEDDLIIRL